AVPWPKHSWMLGQLASSHTVTRRLARSLDLSAATAPLEGIRTRIHDGLRSTGASTNSTGERAILSAATCRSPGRRLPAGASGAITCRGMDLSAGDFMAGNRTSSRPAIVDQCLAAPAPSMEQPGALAATPAAQAAS